MVDTCTIGFKGFVESRYVFVKEAEKIGVKLRNDVRCVFSFQGYY